MSLSKKGFIVLIVAITAITLFYKVSIILCLIGICFFFLGNILGYMDGVDKCTEIAKKYIWRLK